MIVQLFILQPCYQSLMQEKTTVGFALVLASEKNWIHTFCIIHEGVVPSPCDFQSESPRKLVRRKTVNQSFLGCSALFDPLSSVQIYQLQKPKVTYDCNLTDFFFLMYLLFSAIMCCFKVHIILSLYVCNSFKGLKRWEAIA